MVHFSHHGVDLRMSPLQLVWCFKKVLTQNSKVFRLVRVGVVINLFPRTRVTFQFFRYPSDPWGSHITRDGVRQAIHRTISFVDEMRKFMDPHIAFILVILKP